jgi:hypothetical protein
MADIQMDPAQFATSFKAFMDQMVTTAAQDSPLVDRVQAHLGSDPRQLAVMSEEYDSFEHPNLQVGLDAILNVAGRQAELLGVGTDQKRFMQFGLTDLLGRARHTNLDIGPVDYVNIHLAGDQVLPCVQFGIYLVQDGAQRLVVLVTGPTEQGGSRGKLRVEVLASEPEAGKALLMELTGAMRRLNVYRGHVISLSPGEFGPGPRTLIAFHTLPRVERDQVVLSEGVLERVERHTILFAERAERLLAAGRSLKRGMLLYGAPGVGKTLTVMYLAGRMPGRTVILTTGMGLGLLRPVTQLARLLAPAMVVLEDIDLIAEERTRGHTGPLLFELLNEMDGLRDDTDVIFVLTTNRPEILEPALAARPGRIDLAVELPLPDEAGRRRLLDLYVRGLTLRDVDLDALATRIEGASPAYIKELLRKAAVLSTLSDDDNAVTGAHLEAALAELDEGGRLAQRLLGFRSGDAPPEPAPLGPMAAAGFPRPAVPGEIWTAR